MRTVLILGGTTEGSRLAARVADLAGFRPVLSLAGRTAAPRVQPIETRVGGFGGVAGLRAWLRNHDVSRVVDATHPFAQEMSANAAAACAAEGVPRARYTRPPWWKEAGDLWTDVPDLPAAAVALGPTPRRVFLPLGRGSLGAFGAAPSHHYLVRSVDPPGDLPFLPHVRTIVARPPFSREAERALLVRERIEVIVTKNSGGEATRAKLDAARDLNLPVVVVRQPTPPPGPVFHRLEDALAFLTGS